MQIEKVYEPQQFEPYWAQWWIDRGVFQVGSRNSGRMFSIVIPPPNVTGVLHMGHMLEHTEIDVIVRWQRMLGNNPLWVPGTDHAGIATQIMVERQLATEGVTRVQLGREKFEQRVWQWKEESGGTIRKQMVRLGASCDWSRERFTLDRGLSRAVREAFVRLYEKGLIYRGEYMVNWCPRCQTAISDLETVHEETQGHLWHIAYPVIGTDRRLVVATTRPETMLGDTAVAINASDKRYQDLHGGKVLLPLMGREIPIVLDDMADPNFGTGVVKVTPAHDPNDFEAGLRHRLPSIKVIDESARMTAAAGPYAGLDRFEARKQVVEKLQELGLLIQVEDYKLSVARCQRCRTVIEPLVSKQWFVKTKPLAGPAIAVVEDGRIQMVPDHWIKTYNEWMYNIRDWCISRQLWWGHRIPAWHCGDCGGVSVSREDPAACSKCDSGKITQDTDVLDTWFSSGLWPFSTLGWPDKTEDLATFYPTSLLITGFDILFFWVARMVMLGMEMMGDVPFRQVYLHGMVRDAERQKMSKTKGNVIDPIVITEKYGTDAVRLALMLGAAPGTDISLGDERFESSRAFANKLWNASRLIFMKMELSAVEPWLPTERNCCLPQPASDSLQVPLEDRWIFSRLNRCAETVNRAIEQYRFHEAAQTLWHFIWHEVCDWYLELKKHQLVEGSGLTEHWRNLLTVYEMTLRLLHPVMPFLTEELWQRLAKGNQDRPESISLAHYPQYNPEAVDLKAEVEMGTVIDLVTKTRELRHDLNRPKHNEFTLRAPQSDRERLAALLPIVEQLARGKYRLDLGEASGYTVTASATLSVEEEELRRIRVSKEVEMVTKNIANLSRQLGSETFLSRAPANIVESMRQKLAEYESEQRRLQDNTQ